MAQLGMDIGSRSVKIVLWENNNILASRILDTGSFYRDFCIRSSKGLEPKFNELGIGDFDSIVCTGYGRNNLKIKSAKIIVELKAHALGAMWQTGLTDFTLLDIGGQDSKVISIKNSKMVDVLLNDKCAASCGRYLENMCTVIGINSSEISRYYNDPVELNSTCAVFAESELIGLISEGYAIEDLCAGVNYSLFKKIKPLLERFISDKLVVTGGVAYNNALKYFLSKELSFNEIIIPPNPQINGAIGCCVSGVHNE